MRLVASSRIAGAVLALGVMGWPVEAQQTAPPRTPAYVLPQGSPHVIPLATPAGEAFLAWLGAQKGAYEIVSIEKSTSRYVAFVLEARATGKLWGGVFELNAEGRPVAKEPTLQEIPAGKQFKDLPISQTPPPKPLIEARPSSSLSRL
jgi:hypothetical protein